jgi:hypothetical protein
MQCLYIAMEARPDISFATGMLTRVQAWPNPDLLKRAERILIYLDGTKHLKIVYSKTGTADDSLKHFWAPRIILEGYSDASFEVSHSTSGFVFMLANAAIAWMCKKQDTIALHTFDSEIKAGSFAACAAVFLRGPMDEVGFAQLEPSPLYLDSSSAIDLSLDPMKQESSKHILRRDLFIREVVERGLVKPIYIKTDKNVADVMTKALGRGPHRQHRATMLGGEPNP